MQLVEEGRLDLDRDVNAYLDDMTIPDTYPGRPVTLRHLLTHTAGFEENITGTLARNADDVVPLGEHLSENVPARVRPPGEVTSYSNYGVALAGHVVEEVSGVPFERYVEENVFGPLGMRSTTVRPAARPRARAEARNGLRRRGRRSGRGALRVHRRSARRVREHDLDGHGALHDRPPAGRELRRDAHPRYGDRATDARGSVRQRPRPGRDGPPVLSSRT